MLSADDEALVGQREGALLAVEAVLVPGVALVVHHVGAVAEPCRDETDRQKDIEKCLVLIVPVICPNVQHKLVSNDEKLRSYFKYVDNSQYLRWLSEQSKIQICF